jgi:hypothetical protein
MAEIESEAGGEASGEAEDEPAELTPRRQWKAEPARTPEPRAEPKRPRRPSPAELEAQHPRDEKQYRRDGKEEQCRATQRTSPSVSHSLRGKVF